MLDRKVIYTCLMVCIIAIIVTLTGCGVHDPLDDYERFDLTYDGKKCTLYVDSTGLCDPYFGCEYRVTTKYVKGFLVEAFSSSQAASDAMNDPYADICHVHEKRP